MVSFKSVLASAALLVVSIAQETPVIAFTSVPAVAVAGETYNITWGGGDGSSVTLTLRKGDPNNLDDLGPIATRLSGDYYLWTVNKTLMTASDYALQITQGQSDINYSGRFAIVGGTGSSSISYSGLTTSTANGTITTHGITMTPSTTASMGTGTSMVRNTTFSSQSLSATASTRATLTNAVNSATSTSAQSTSAPNTNIGASMGSSAALVMGLFGAIVFLQ